MAVLSALRDTIGYFGERAVANPGTAGGATALAVAMTFFTANAVYFQDHQHPAALFATRPEPVEMASLKVPAPRRVEQAAAPRATSAPEASRFATTEAEAPRTRAVVIPDIAPIPARRPEFPVATIHAEQPDQMVAGIQELLHKLGYYDGDIDGVRGPMTGAAIDSYKQKAGLRGIELSEAERSHQQADAQEAQDRADIQFSCDRHDEAGSGEEDEDFPQIG